MKTCFIVTFTPDESKRAESGIIGVFSTAELATAQCLDRRYICTTLAVDAPMPHDRPSCPPLGCFRPNPSEPDPALVATQLAAIVERNQRLAGVTA